MTVLSRLESRKRFLRIDADTSALLMRFRPVLERGIDRILDMFYEHVLAYPELEAMFSDGAILNHARAAQRDYWLNSVFSGRFDQAYLDKAIVIAQTHERVGLRPEFYLGGYELALEQIMGMLEAAFGPTATDRLTGRAARKLRDCAAIRDAVLRAVYLDMGLVVDVYFAEVQKTSARVLNELASEFENNVAGVVSDLTKSAGEMKTVAGSMSSAAEQSSQQATVVAGAADEASANVQTVATASEELSTSIAEIGRQVSESSRVTREAVDQAEATNKAVLGLANTVERIGEIVDMITKIAEQTNLLALNATIESARAGEAGKGFAVVASEVKNLAQQTARATEEIAAQISGVQSATRESVEAIERIGTTIASLDGISSAISSAVEQQGAATQEISRNVQEAAAGTDEVTRSIALVSTAAGETGAAATQVRGSADVLADRSDELSSRVESFLGAIRQRSNVDELTLAG